MFCIVLKLSHLCVVKVIKHKTFKILGYENNIHHRFYCFK